MVDYQEIYRKYEVKIKERILLFENQFHAFLQQYKIGTDTVVLPPDILFDFVVNYFADIDRLKEFHQVKLVNTIRIASYEAYWFSRLKPIQVLKIDPEKKSVLLLINEYFAASTLFAHFFDRNQPIVDVDWGRYNTFFNHLMYNLRYRIVTPSSLELTLLALFSDPVYQQKK